VFIATASAMPTDGISNNAPDAADPADSVAPLPAAWTGLGLSTADGVTVKRSVDKEGTEHWQQLTPARYIYKGLELTVASVFQE
jgi:hypothetical protein